VNEKEHQEQVLELALRYGWAHFHPFDMRRSDAGWPDLVLIRPPELLVVELKTDKGRMRPRQQIWLDELAACGVETAVWRPRDFEELHARLARGVRAGTAGRSALLT
jgi:hypothetical protein